MRFVGSCWRNGNGVPEGIVIEADWENLERGTPEERACFAAVGIRQGNIWLTQAEDSFVNRVRSKVYVSAYLLAEWLAWNWWRLRWEPPPHAQVRLPAQHWELAHSVAAIGAGYVWPNIVIASDGQQVTFSAKPTRPDAREALRYVVDHAATIPAGAFENAIDAFFDQVREQLRAGGVSGSNFERIHNDLVAERADPEAASRRRFEALLGFDPDEAPEAEIENLMESAGRLGESAMNEVAAERGQSASPLTAERLKQDAKWGFDVGEGPRLAIREGRQLQGAGARITGVAAARELRKQEGLGDDRVSNQRLAALAAVGENSLTSRKVSRSFSFSYALMERNERGRLVFRSKWEVGRRFELARILGDHVLETGNDRLFPATRTNTYRQAVQRAFAAELLCPLAVVEGMLDGDYSEERQLDVANHFQVSDWVVRTSLEGHGLIERGRPTTSS